MSEETILSLPSTVLGKALTPDLFLGVEIHGEECCGKKTTRVKELEVVKYASGAVRRIPAGKVFHCEHCGKTKRA
jgi:hypothetical protein